MTRSGGSPQRAPNPPGSGGLAGAGNPLAEPVTRLPRIGAVRAGALAEHGVRTVGDLLRTIPRRYLDRSDIPPIGSVRPSKEEVTVLGRVVNVATLRGKGRRRRTVARITDGTGSIECVWFGEAGWVYRAFEPGTEVAVTGVPKRFRTIQIAHPEFELLGAGEELLHMGRIIPVYPQSATLNEAGLHTRGMRLLVKRTFDWMGIYAPDPVPPSLLERQGLSSLIEALRAAHFPESFEAASEARRRLVFDEFLGLELALARRKHALAQETGGIEFADVGERFGRILDRLPFELTDGQKGALREIRRDMRRAAPMSRLLQGDVGSGKTLVAVLCAAMAADNGYQTAVMVPTEVLAEQHILTMGKLLFEVGVTSTLLTGSTRAAQRRRALSEIATGEADVVIGTHALISDDVTFRRLGLVVVDEQHRFGVVQRERLRKKTTPVPDLLVMTATPIPRSLAQTLYGDLDVSIMRDKPPGRQPIATRVVRPGDEASVWQLVRDAAARGEQTYVVFPLVEESEGLDLKAAKSAFEDLHTGPLDGLSVGLLHGRMKAAERDQVMYAFKAGRLDVLVSTTVIEVGVDVPNATVMVIEGAERFGLSQLHQLRGRIGRGERPSECLLIPATTDVTDDARRRLSAMARTDDGFDLAGVDLEIRGPGEFFGTKQSGIPEFRFADILRDAEVLVAAREEAFALVDRDPDLEAAEHRGLRSLCAPYQRALKEAGERTVA